MKDSGESGISADARTLSKILGVEELVGRIKQARDLTGSFATELSLEKLSARQDLSDAKQELLYRIMKTNLEVDYVLSAIDGEQNHYTERISELMSKRDRAVWRTTILSQWSNGILWSGSSAFTVGSVKNPNLSYPDGILGILAGAIPTVLALYAMHQSKGGKVDANFYPNMLAPVYDLQSNKENFLPSSVMTFLTERDLAKGKSRKQLLKERWIDMGYLEKPGSKSYESMISLITGCEARKKSLTLSILQNRQQMLDDLRSTVFQMKRVLVELIKLAD